MVNLKPAVNHLPKIIENNYGPVNNLNKDRMDKILSVLNKGKNVQNVASKEKIIKKVEKKVNPFREITIPNKKDTNVKILGPIIIKEEDKMVTGSTANKKADILTNEIKNVLISSEVIQGKSYNVAYGMNISDKNRITYNDINQNNYLTVMKIGEVYGDGSCLYHALLKCMEVNENLHMELRGIIANYLSAHTELLIENEEKWQIEMYLNGVRSEKYGTFVEIVAFTYIMACRVVVMVREIECNEFNIYEVRDNSIGSEPKFTIYLILDSYYSAPNKSHYNSLIPNDKVRHETEANWHLGANHLRFLLIGNKPKTYTNIVEVKEKESEPAKNAEIKTEDEIDWCEAYSDEETVLETVNVKEKDKEDGNKAKDKENKKKNTIKSEKTGKRIGSRIGDEDRKIFEPVNKGIDTGKSSKEYVLKKTNNELPDNKKVNFRDIIETHTKFEDVCYLFTKANIEKNGTENYKREYKNIIFDEELSSDLKSKYNITDETQKSITRAICFECSGTNKDNKPLYRSYRSLFELKEHCNKFHDSSMKHCVVNYELPNGYIEILARKGVSNIVFVIGKDCLIALNREKVEQFEMGAGGFREESDPTLNYIKIYGANVRKLTNENNIYLVNFIDQIKPDFLLLNECSFGNSKFKINGYKMIGEGGKTCIIHKEEYGVHVMLHYLNDNWNLICKVNCSGKNLILYSAYLSPDERHNTRIEETLHRLEIIKNRYTDMKLILFGDFNMNRKDFKNKVEKHVNKLGYIGHFEKGEHCFTRYQMVEGKMKWAYIDYMITHGIENVKMTIKNNFVNSDHMSLEMIIDKDELKELQHNKEIVDPIVMVRKKSEGIAELLREAIMSESPMKQILQLINDLRIIIKPKCRKPRNIFNFANKIANDLMEEEKKGSYESIRVLVSRAKKTEWNSFLGKLQDMRVKNNVKEYFLKMRFYTELNRNVDIVHNLEEIDVEGESVLITDKYTINKRILVKYKALLGDNGSKEEYFENSQVTNFKLTDFDVFFALKEMSLDKAVSWDLIPGLALEKFKNLKGEEYTSLVVKLTDMLNEIIQLDGLPEEIVTSRLLCLNKEATKPGNVDNLRPIAIASTLLKIIEWGILNRLLNTIKEKKLISKKQIGFMKNAGTELNLMRIRSRTHDLKKLKINKLNKYILFIDLKNAYDKVNHKRLFMKLRKAKIGEDIITIIEKIYSKAGLKIDTLNEKINVNNGVLQGSLISPMLFNLYINDLIEDIDKMAFEILAYADDLAVICENETTLVEVMKVIHRWSEENGIMVNKKKSGILVIQGKEDRKEINGYPIVKRYKYLGVLIDSQLNCKDHIQSVRKRLESYFSRNFMINSRFFSVKSILTLFGYFQRSRLLYGMNCFVDLLSPIRTLESITLTNLKMILRLPVRTSNNRLKICLGLPDLKVYLVTRLIKALKKYEMIFGEKCEYYDKTINDTIGNGNETEDIENILNNNIIELGLAEGVRIDEKLRRRTKKEIYTWYVDRDHLLVRFWCNRGFFRKDICKDCKNCGLQDVNSREHAVNECSWYEDKRNNVLKRIWKTHSLFKDKELSEIFEEVYFNPDTRLELYQRKRIYGIMKEFILELYAKQKMSGNNNHEEKDILYQIEEKEKEHIMS